MLEKLLEKSCLLSIIGLFKLMYRDDIKIQRCVQPRRRKKGVKKSPEGKRNKQTLKPEHCNSGCAKTTIFPKCKDPEKSAKMSSTVRHV